MVVPLVGESGEIELSVYTLEVLVMFTFELDVSDRKVVEVSFMRTTTIVSVLAQTCTVVVDFAEGEDALVMELGCPKGDVDAKTEVEAAFDQKFVGKLVDSGIDPSVDRLEMLIFVVVLKYEEPEPGEIAFAKELDSSITVMVESVE